MSDSQLTELTVKLLPFVFFTLATLVGLDSVFPLPFRFRLPFAPAFALAFDRPFKTQLKRECACLCLRIITSRACGGVNPVAVADT